MVKSLIRQVSTDFESKLVGCPRGSSFDFLEKLFGEFRFTEGV
jgi:hypothetical protein